MKYLIFFLLLAPMSATSQEISAQLEFDTLADLHIGMEAYPDTSTYILQEYTKLADWVMTRGPVITTIDGEKKVVGVCQIVEEGIIRYGLAVEIIGDEGTTLAIFPLPASDNLLWEQLVQKQK